MLDPDYLERAGDMVCGVYSEIEADLCDHLVRAMLAGDIGDWRSQLALQLLAQGQAPQLRMVLERHRGKVRRAVREEVEEALRRSDAADLMVVREALGVDLPKVTTQQVAAVVRTITEMLERDNVDLMNGARDAFLREATWAVTQTNVGMLSPDAAVERATRRLARRGIDVVQYRDPTTGDKTVRNRVDVAVRRHIRSQLQQACNERTMQVCRDAGCDFVEVSSHYGARPSHQDWEGRRYHIGGRVTVGDETFEDFAEATGYYGTGSHGALGDRLCGVNCRHSFGPWVPGMPHAYEPDPRHPSGKSNEEIYALTQRQRAMERGIRDTKRELKAAEATYEANPTLKNQTEANKVRDSLRRQQERLAKLCEENRDILKRQANREGPIDTRGTAPKGSGRSVDEYLSKPSLSKRIKKAGISPTKAKREISQEMRARELSPRDFPRLTTEEQADIANSALFRKKGLTHRKTGEDGQQLATKALVAERKKKVERRGGQLLLADEKQREYLKERGATAVTFGDTAIITDSATTSDVLEESHHALQNIEGMNADKPAEIIIILNEIDAKEYLLRNATRYNIPKEETELTKRQLEDYRRQLEDYKRRTGWHE